MTVNYETYNNEKLAFIRKHDKKEWHIETSPMDEYGVYYKTYIFEDGAQWCERMSPEYETIETEVHFVKVKAEVKFLKTEFWSTESGSKYYYEKF